jgi:hypothetical protein
MWVNNYYIIYIEYFLKIVLNIKIYSFTTKIKNIFNIKLKTIKTVHNIISILTVM